MLSPRRTVVCHAALLAGVLIVLIAPGARAGVAGPVDLTVTVSLEANPDPLGEDGLRYEQILKDFAAIVFDATEGAHRIGTIRVYRGGSRHDSADIIWQRRGQAMASLNGFRPAGSDPGQMYMADVFSGAASDGSDLPLVDAEDVMDHPDGDLDYAGALLAHEWGHYAYGLLDEHVIDGGDIAVLSTLMSSPWTAATDTAWRNFSIAPDAVPGFAAFENTLATAHDRAYEQSAWELIGQMPDVGADLVSPIPGRLEREAFVELFGLPATGVPTFQNLGTPPTIEWADACSRYAIAIDKSGSMTGAPLATAKALASLMIELFPADSTELLLIEFGDAGEAVLPLQPQQVVSDDVVGGMTQRQTLLAAVAGVSAAPEETSFLAGLDEAHARLDLTCPFGDPPTSKALFFISDGTNRDGENLDSAIDRFTSDGIPIYVIDVSPFMAGETVNSMTPLVARTGGVLVGPNAFASFLEVQQTFGQADATSRIRHLLGRQTVALPAAGSSNLFQFTVDPTLDRFDLCASASGPVETLVLNAPTGTAQAGLAFRQTDPMEPGDSCSFFWAANLPEPGVWTLVAPGVSTPGVTIDLEAHGQNDASSVTLRAWVSNASIPILYPEPIHVTATLAEDRPIVGALVEATLDGGPAVRLRDDGVRPDAIQDDGIYVGSLLYDADCDPTTSPCNRILVHAEDVSGFGAFSSSGIVLAPGVQGNVLTAEAQTSIDFHFERFVEMSGPETMGFTTSTAPVLVMNENEAVNGRILAPGEVDTYTIDIPNLMGLGEVRVSGALLGMKPRLRVLDSSGDLIDDQTAANGVGGLAIPVDFGLGPLTAEVLHASDAIGTYQLSAGGVLNLDFGAAGGGASPCDTARTNKSAALNLMSTLAGVVEAQSLITESRDLEREMIDGIERLSDPSSGERKARKLLRKAATRAGKALKRLRRAERKSRGEELSGARRKIRNSMRKLSRACRSLSEGGANLLQ